MSQGADITVSDDHAFFVAATISDGNRPRSTELRQSTRMFLYFQLMIIDCVSIVLGLLVSSALLGTLWTRYGGLETGLMMVPLYLVFGLNDGAFTIKVLQRVRTGIRCALKALGLGVLAVLLVAFLFRTGDTTSRLTFALGVSASAILIAINRFLFSYRVRAATGGQLTNEMVILDGVEARFASDVVVVDAGALRLEPDAQNPRMLEQFGMLTKGFDRVIVECDPARRNAWALLLKGADVDGEIMVRQFNEIGAIAINGFRGIDTLVVSRRALTVPERANKRLLDLAIAVPALIALLPLFLIVSIAIKLETRGPILFKQNRVGRGNRLFKVMKFRSMRVEESDHLGARSTQRDDDRITRVGRIIRQTSIDELPQLLNVLLGDMSLVGPRPHALGSLAGNQLFWEVDQTYWHRHRLKPGITGLAQIRGHRGTTHESKDLTSRLQADLEYIEGWSIWRDLGILANTFRVIVHRNAY